MSVIPDDLFLKMVCPYLSPIAMYNARLIGYNTTILRFLKQKRIDPNDDIEDYICPCCGDWLFEEWSEISKLIYCDHFDDFCAYDGQPDPDRYDDILLLFEEHYSYSADNVIRRRIRCIKCFKSHWDCRPYHDLNVDHKKSFPYAGSRRYLSNSHDGIISYTKENDPDNVYWDEVKELTACYDM